MDEKTFPRQFKESEAAKIMNVSREKLRTDRCHGIGAPYRKYGRSVRYDEHELRSWMAEQSTVARAAK